MPIKLTKDFLKRSLYKKYIPSIDANVPTNEKIKIYDKKDPEIKACPKIFSIPRAKYSLDDKITSIKHTTLGLTKILKKQLW